MSEHTKGELIAMQSNLGLGHKGEIILTTQDRVDNNQPMIAKEVIDAEHAERLVLCWNSHDDLLAACEGLLGAMPPALQKKWPNNITRAEAAIAAVKQ